MWSGTGRDGAAPSDQHPVREGPGETAFRPAWGSREALSAGWTSQAVKAQGPHQRLGIWSNRPSCPRGGAAGRLWGTAAVFLPLLQTYHVLMSLNLSAMVTILCTYFKMMKLKIIWYSFQIPFLSICFKLVTHGQDKCHQVRFSPLIYFFMLVVCNWLVLKRRPTEEKIKDSRIQWRPKHVFLFAFI